MSRWAWGWCCTVICMAAFAHPRAEAKAIVVFHSWDWRAPENVVADRVFRETLKPAGDSELYSEFIDEARFSGPVRERNLANFLRERYAGIEVGVVIARDPSAVCFLMSYRDEIFPGVPVAFAGIRDATLARLNPPPDFIGSPLTLNAQPTVELAMRLWPAGRQFVIVTGTSELDRIWERHLLEACKTVAPKLPCQSLAALPQEEILRKVAALPRESIVLAGPFRRDAKGETRSDVYAMLESLHAASKAPIFHSFESAVGRGALASHSVPFESTPREAALIANQILAGIAPAAVSLPAPAQAIAFVDWGEMKRWGVPESRLPPGTVIRSREPAFWDEYRYLTLGIGSAVLLQSALIALLLVQRRRQRLADAQLRQNEDAMKLAVESASLSLWSWDIGRDGVAGYSSTGQFLSVPPGGNRLETFLASIHPDDRDTVRRAIQRALDDDGHYESEYRAPDPGGKIRWFVGRGRVVRDARGARQLRGITLDITARKAAELEAQHRRNELAHLSRVTMVGEMSGSIAHELNQPLTAILANAQAAQMFIRHEPVDLVELAAILDDIVENDKRAGAIILSLRKMLKKEESTQVLLGVNDLVLEGLRLMRNDLVNREVSVEMQLAPGNLLVRGDRTQLQQVLINLLINACDAMSQLARPERIVAIRIELAGSDVRVEVADRGDGIAADSLEEVFTPFYTTKPHGLGLGLAVCRTIIAAHGGSLRARNNPGGGATFTLTLAAEAAPA